MIIITMRGWEEGGVQTDRRQKWKGKVLGAIGRSLAWGSEVQASGSKSFQHGHQW